MHWLGSDVRLHVLRRLCGASLGAVRRYISDSDWGLDMSICWRCHDSRENDNGSVVRSAYFQDSK